MSMNTDTAAVVSFDDESLILVDLNDNVLGHMPKAEAHQGAGALHRALSIFLFNSNGELLLQQRDASKQLWGGSWSNSVCSHPRQGETVAAAARRRLREEVDIDAELTWLYKFVYQATFGEIGSEYEMCSVFVACSDAAVAVNANEIADFSFVPPETLDAELVKRPEHYTPWMKMEWARIRQDYWATVSGLVKNNDR
jgi:isopentenyl-diphosphate delta-isomerase